MVEACRIGRFRPRTPSVVHPIQRYVTVITYLLGMENHKLRLVKSEGSCLG